MAALIAAVAWLPALIVILSLRRLNQALARELGNERELANSTARRLRFLTALASSLIDQAPLAMLLVDADRRVSYFNESALGLFAIRAGAARGRQLIEVIRDHDLEAMVRRALAGEQTDALEVRPPGSDRLLRARACRVVTEDGEFGVSLVVEDVTELHRVATMSRQLVANVSHELRSPVAIMKALVETLQSGAIEDRHLALDFLAKIDRELDSTTVLIRDLLELSRIESGHVSLDMELLDARDIVRETMNRLRPTFDEVGLTLETVLNGPAPVVTDRHRASQILTNLVENAIKFTPSGKVTVRLARQQGEVRISTEDTGVGIDQDELPRVFERFYKVDKSRSRNGNSGTGLGLAIAKHLVSILGGRIWAESQEGHGSTFCFTLPLAATSKGDSGPRKTVGSVGVEDVALPGR
ncbi:MAG: PAS domain-containing protein [Chloroflexota bacterium]|nr:PAS domain-containing protein [Chloroflexota bacterium]